ncbi:YdeI family protein [Rickettsiales bacterium LUAb2]
MLNPKVDFFFVNAEKWQQEFKKLRAIILSNSQLTEDLKWGCPSYTLQNKNIVLIHGFKEYCAILFFKGALIKDPQKIMIQQSKNVQFTRQIRFTNLQEIITLENIIKEYINEAIIIEQTGFKVTFNQAPLPTVDEFNSKLDKNPLLNKAFNNLTPGRKRAYLLYFSAPKQSKTREARIEKYIPEILKGKGLNDI